MWNYNTEVGHHLQWNNSNYLSWEPKRKFGLNTEQHNYQLRLVISYQSAQPEIHSQDVFFSSILKKKIYRLYIVFISALRQNMIINSLQQEKCNLL